MQQHKQLSLTIPFLLDEVVIKDRESNIIRWLLRPTNWSFALTAYKVKKRYNLHDPADIANKISALYPKLRKQAEIFKQKLIQATPNTPMIEILKKLHKKGFTIVTASNMTKSTFKALVDKNIIPQTLFSKDCCFIKTKKINKKPDGSYYKKPESTYYNNLKKYIEKKYPGKFKHIIFTDDKRENVQAAHKQGLISIRFRNPKQFTRALQQLGITP